MRAMARACRAVAWSSCAKAGCSLNPTTLASNQGMPAEIAVDATNVYWTNVSTNEVMRCAIGGCGGKPTVLATGAIIAGGIAVDATSVYWATRGSAGNIYKLTPK